MSVLPRKSEGFTIVELLIVIVVIAILAAISVVAYNGLQQRARDSDRRQSVSTLKKALELYKIDNGGYPQCGSGTHTAGTGGSGGTIEDCLKPQLVPKYIAKLPNDPLYTGVSWSYYQFYYNVGYRKTGATTAVYDMTSNYTIGGRLETVTSPTYDGYSVTGLTMLEGSSN